MSSSGTLACVFQPVERRLEDAVALWEKAQKSYFSPDDFRLHLQACIQSFRSVTWVLQHQKDKLHNFDLWYSSWQLKMRSDPILRWLVEARNKIEKQGDLETRSTLKLTFSQDWNDTPSFEMELPPTTKPNSFGRLFASRFPKERLPDEALLKVERRWVDSELHDTEVLEALCHCYTELSKLILDAHEVFSAKTKVNCDFAHRLRRTNFALPNCMLTAASPRVAWVKLKTGEAMEMDTQFQTFDVAESKALVKARYGYTDSELKGLCFGADLREQCVTQLRMAKRHLEVDGYVIPVALLVTERGVQIYQVGMQDRADKHIVIRDLADVAKRLKATSVIIVTEAWSASVSLESEATLFKHAEDYPDRGECIIVHGLTCEGKAVDVFAPFERKEGKFHFGPERVIEGMPPNSLRPFLAVWNLKDSKSPPDL